MAEIAVYYPYFHLPLEPVLGSARLDHFPNSLREIIPWPRETTFHTFTVDPRATETAKREALTAAIDGYLRHLTAETTRLHTAREAFELFVPDSDGQTPELYAKLAEHYETVRQYFHAREGFYRAQIGAYEASTLVSEERNFVAEAEAGQAAPGTHPHSTRAKVISAKLGEDVKLPALSSEKEPWQSHLTLVASYRESAADSQKQATAAEKCATYYASGGIGTPPDIADLHEGFTLSGSPETLRRRYEQQLRSLAETQARFQDIRKAVSTGSAAALDEIQAAQLDALPVHAAAISAMSNDSARARVFEKPLTDLLRQSSAPDGARSSADTVRLNPRIFELALAAGANSLGTMVHLQSSSGGPYPFTYLENPWRTLVAAARAAEPDEIATASVPPPTGVFAASLHFGAHVSRHAAAHLRGREPESPSAVLRRYQQAGRGPAARTAQTMPGRSPGGPDRPSRKI